MISDEVMISLTLCPCGHGIARHDEAGCPGARATFCMCTLTASAALDAAIERIHRASSAGRGRTMRPRLHPVRGR
jgi:hypothetical protein